MLFPKLAYKDYGFNELDLKIYLDVLNLSVKWWTRIRFHFPPAISSVISHISSCTDGFAKSVG